MARFPVLESLEISKPCSARWEEMKGDGQVRFCDHCQKNVHRLTELDPAEAEALVARAGSDLCVRMPAQRDTRPWFQSSLARAGLALASVAGLVAPLAQAEPGPKPPPPCDVGIGNIPTTYPDGGAEPIRETMGKPAYHPQKPPPQPKPAPKPPDEIQGK